MRNASLVFLFIGAIFVTIGHGCWWADHRSTQFKLDWVIYMIPGWSLVTMGWCGLLHRQILVRASQPSDSGPLGGVQ
jgi:hypothetical protein